MKLTHLFVMLRSGALFHGHSVLSSKFLDMALSHRDRLWRVVCFEVRHWIPIYSLLVLISCQFWVPELRLEECGEYQAGTMI
jgi:hypothetical protein